MKWVLLALGCLCVNEVRATRQIPFKEVTYSCHGNERFVTITAVDRLTQGYETSFLWNHNLGTAQSVTVSEKALLKGDIVCRMACTCGGSAFSALAIDFSRYVPHFAIHKSDADCHNSLDGRIEVNLVDNTDRLLWEDGSSEPVRDHLGYGSYAVKVFDGLGCYEEVTVTIKEPDSFALPAYHTAIKDVSCTSLSDGLAEVTFDSILNPLYKLTWTSGAIGTKALSLKAGAYLLKVKKSSTECASIPIRIQQPEALQIRSRILSAYHGYAVSCYHNNDGKIMYWVAGGTQPYATAFSHLEVKENVAPGEPVEIDSLLAASYFIRATDSHGCSSETNLVLNAPKPVTISHSRTYKDVDIRCNGESEVIHPVIDGVVGTYSYLWTQWNQTSHIYDTLSTGAAPVLKAGNYQLHILDENHCSGQSDISVTQPETIDYEQPFFINLLGVLKIAKIRLTGGYTKQYIWDGKKRKSKLYIWLFKKTKEIWSVVSDGNSCKRELTILFDSHRFPKTDPGEMPVCPYTK